MQKTMAWIQMDKRNCDKSRQKMIELKNWEEHWKVKDAAGERRCWCCAATAAELQRRVEAVESATGVRGAVSRGACEVQRHLLIWSAHQSYLLANIKIHLLRIRMKKGFEKYCSQFALQFSFSLMSYEQLFSGLERRRKCWHNSPNRRIFPLIRV